MSASYTTSRHTAYAGVDTTSRSSSNNNSSSSGNGSRDDSQPGHRGSAGSEAAQQSTSDSGTASSADNAAQESEFTAEELQASLSSKEAESLKLRAEVEKLTDAVKRGLADMENLRQRTAREMDSTRKFAVQGFAKSLFDVADNLARAIEAVPPQALTESTNMPPEQLAGVLKGLVGGLGGVEKMLLQALKSGGVEQYNPVGEPFDPNLHSALFEVQDPTKEAGTIAVVTKRGYKMHDRVVRPAEVGVVKA